MTFSFTYTLQNMTTHVWLYVTYTGSSADDLVGEKLASDLEDKFKSHTSLSHIVLILGS